MEQPSYYTIIPAPIRYSDAPPREILMYGEITALSNKYGYCTASNSYFSKLYKVNNDTVSSWITDMVNRKWIRRELIREGKQVKQRQLYLRSLPALQEHEGYPEKTGEVPRKNGGGYPEKTGEGTPKNTEENSTSINNTSNNKNNNNNAFSNSQELADRQEAIDVLETIHAAPNAYWVGSFNAAKKEYGEEFLKAVALVVAKTKDDVDYSYFDTTLRNYVRKGITTPEGVRKEVERHKKLVDDFHSRKEEFLKNGYRAGQTNYQATGAVDFTDPRRLDGM